MSHKKQIQLSDHFNYRKLLRFTILSIIMMMFTSLYSIVDGFCICLMNPRCLYFRTGTAAAHCEYHGARRDDRRTEIPEYVVECGRSFTVGRNFCSQQLLQQRQQPDGESN